jgi:hypothetical protein
MCLQAAACSISSPQAGQARVDGQSAPTTFFFTEFSRISNRGSRPEQPSFPHSVVEFPDFHILKHIQQNSNGGLGSLEQ